MILQESASEEHEQRKAANMPRGVSIWPRKMAKQQAIVNEEKKMTLVT
jgi:hypothetical protein